MKKISLSIFFAAMLLVSGCGDKTASTTTGGTPAPEATTTTTTGGVAGTTGTPDVAISMTELPAELKHEAFQYYGLAGENEVMYEMTSTRKEDATLSGAQQSKLVKVANGEATFKVSWTGQLADIGESEMVLKKDGLHATMTNGMPVEPAQLELPAELKTGFEWTNSGTFNMASNQKVTQQTKQKVLGAQKVKTPAGTFDAIAVKLDGTAEVDGKKTPMDTTIWFVKGVGAVKMEIKSSVDGKPTTKVLQATKITKVTPK